MTAAAQVQPENTKRPFDRDDKPRIVVVGSINMDLVVRASEMPSPGQTVMGHNFSTIPGGKGANQAIAASHCGAQVNLIGRVGNDDFGGRLLMGLKAHGVNTAAVSVSEGISTGTAMIVVDDNGENAICVAGGANKLLNIEDIDDQLELFTRADLVLMQMEIPYETVLYTIELGRRYKIPVILNPAPAPTAEAMKDAPLNIGPTRVTIRVLRVCFVSSQPMMRISFLGFLFLVLIERFLFDFLRLFMAFIKLLVEQRGLNVWFWKICRFS